MDGAEVAEGLVAPTAVVPALEEGEDLAVGLLPGPEGRAIQQLDLQGGEEGLAQGQLWVADITYVPTWAGFVYLAVVLDAWSRRIVGWAMRSSLKTELVLDALHQRVLRLEESRDPGGGEVGGPAAGVRGGGRPRVEARQ